MDVINPEVRLAIRRKPGRAGLREITVAIPLGVTDAGHAENAANGLPFKLLNLGTGEIEHELIALQFQFAFRLRDHPIRMLLEQFALWAGHFRFEPDAELKAALHRL